MERPGLAELIARTERVATGKAMTGNWSATDEARLSTLYDERRCLRDEGADYE
ncbi:hypothetical protein ATJ78_0192 [Paramicrobacterium agarici]|uniref:Uncharacterized protein n=2 Tax=Paramicrobacterium agarici TaxID=630514 RepID=A0A2A9DSC9_9MICO|nr:hypothetical protein ATJ78_0192 [Microbacterium agarici]